MTDLVQTTQLVSGLAWLVIALWMIGSAYRLLLTHRPRLYDPVRAVFFFMGVLQFGFSLRWLVWPRTLPAMESGELMTWLALYSLSILLAVWTGFIARARGCGKPV